MVVLVGASNQSFLGVIDCLHGLFVKNCVVYLKQHAMQGYVNTMLEVLFAPLIERGFFSTELHSTVERSASLVYHPSVKAVHLTGGKTTHDTIVWGSDAKERESNLQNGTPKLKAAVSSELGAVSPWIVVPGVNSQKELETQAKLVAVPVGWRLTIDKEEGL